MKPNHLSFELAVLPRHRFVLLSVLLVTTAVFAIACNDSEGNPFAEPTPTAGQAAATTAPSSGTPGATRPPGTTTTSSTPTASGTPLSGTSLPARLPDLNSYRYSMRVEGTAGLVAEMSELGLPAGVNPTSGTLVFEVKGSYVKPDRSEAAVSFSGIQATIVTITRQQWQLLGGLVQGPSPLTLPSEEDYSFVASFWDDGPDVSQFNCAVRETVNNVSTRKCTADRAAIERAMQQDPDFFGGISFASISRATAEIWLAEPEKVIRMRLDVAGRDTSNRDVALKMDIDIMDINTNITINPPR